MKRRNDHPEREDGTVTKLESMWHKGTTTKDSTEISVLEEIADMIVTTEDGGWRRTVP